MSKTPERVKRSFRLSLYLISLFLISCSARMEMARLPLPHVTPELETPEFWTAKIDNPDSVLLTSENIDSLNRDIASNVYLVDVLLIGNKVSGGRIRKAIVGDFEHHKKRTRYGHNNYPLPESFYKEIERRMDLDSIPEKIDVSFGLTTRRTDIRSLPTSEIAMEKKNDYEFDYFQHSALGIGEPVALYHFSNDRAWAFVQASFTHGWVRTVDIGIGESKKDIKAYLRPSEKLVITGNIVHVYSDSTRTRFLGSLGMGSTVPLVRSTEEGYAVQFPFRDADGNLLMKEGFIHGSEDVSEGYVLYSPANVLRQAFKSLHQPYGWGGMFETKDCSRYVLDVFATFGIDFPRNSRSQLKAGQSIAAFDRDVSKKHKLESLHLARPGLTIIGFPGHVMIYLGQHNGRFYAIHNTWAYRKKRWFVQDTKHIGKVVVSDLTLGEGSKKGSLLERLTEIRHIGF
ncbi:MAG: SH3 domain-containing protein [Gemmatimonadota bacterium]|nr:MAG: SH3 domain-containing protein [Gemmatimonadota bacterium]